MNKSDFLRKASPYLRFTASFKLTSNLRLTASVRVTRTGKLVPSVRLTTSVSPYTKKKLRKT